MSKRYKKQLKPESIAAWICCAVMILVTFVSVGFAAFNNTVKIESPNATIRVVKDIRISSINVVGIDSESSLIYTDYNVAAALVGLNLAEQNSYVTVEVEVKNLGNTIMGIRNIAINDNLTYDILNYQLGTKICDDANPELCKNGATKKIQVRVGYKPGAYNPSNVYNDILADFNFEQVHSISYTEEARAHLAGSAPTEAIHNSNATINLSNVDLYSIVVQSGTKKLTLGQNYTYQNGVLTIRNIQDDITIDYCKGQEEEALEEQLASGQDNANGLSVRYLGDNTYVINGHNSATDYIYTTITGQVKINFIGNLAWRNMLLNIPRDIMSAGDNYKFTVTPISGTVTGLTAPEQFQINFHSRDQNDGSPVDSPKYDFFSGNIGGESGILSKQLNVATIFMSKDAQLEFNDYTFKVSLSQITKPSPTAQKTVKIGGLTLTYNNDGSYELDGTINSEAYILLDGENSKGGTKAADAKDYTLLYNAGEKVRLNWWYLGGSYTDKSKHFILTLRELKTLEANKVERLWTLHPTNPFDPYKDASIEYTTYKEYESLTMYIKGPQTFNHLKFYATTEKVME